MSLITFDDLFAYRLQCLDLTDNELNIIRQLKYFLYNKGIDYDTLNIYILEFYIYINISITLDEIELVNINKQLYINNFNTQKVKSLDYEDSILHNEYIRVYNEISNYSNNLKNELNKLSSLKDTENNKDEITKILNVLNTRYNDNNSTSYIYYNKK